MNWRIRSLVVATVLLTAFSCRETADEPPFSVVPEISLKGLSGNSIIEFEDVLTLSIHYRDGDGDLGFEEPDTYAVFIRDARLLKYDGFYLGPVAPPGAVIPVQGVLNVEFPNLFVFGTRNEETTRFHIYMIDRNGHKSNEVVTPQVTVKKKG